MTPAPRKQAQTNVTDYSFGKDYVAMRSDLVNRTDLENAKILREFIGRQYLRAEWETRRAVRLPKVSRRARMRNSVWAVTMVRDEVDVLPGTIDHLREQGITGMVIADNGSSDGTLEYLESLAVTDPTIHVIRDPLRAYHQSNKMTLLARFARRLGADWIIPFDADEHWMADGQPLRDFFATTDATAVEARLHNLFPTQDAGGEVRLDRLDLTPHRDSKIAFKSAFGAIIMTGNHDVLRSGPRSRGLYIVHLPWRSREQMERKVRVGLEALRAARVDMGVGTHWQRLSLPDVQLDRVWEDLVQGHQNDLLGWTPMGPFVKARADRWRSWDPEGLLRALEPPP